MERRLVSLYAWVHDRQPGGQPPGGGGGGGGGPVDPGYGVPGWPGQELPRPQPPYPPYVDIGFPGNQPYPDQGLPGNQPGIWGPNDPRPTPPIYWPGYPGGGGGGGGGGRWPGDPGYGVPGWPNQDLPGNQPYPDNSLPGNQPYPDQSLPGYQPYPDNSLPGNQPGIWDPRPPYVDIGFPGPQPGGPVYVDNTLPTIPGIRPTPPMYNPGPPSFDPNNLPDHPEVPDLNTGKWGWIQDPETRQSVLAFVTYPLVVTHPDYNPQYPPEETQPGRWVITMSNYRMTWAWLPERPEPNRDLPGPQPKKAAEPKSS